MASSPQIWNLTIPSDLRLLRLARTFIESICEVAGLDETTTHAIVLATDEATNNAMRHAHEDKPDAMIRIECQLKDDCIEIRLEDEGQPFDINGVPHLDPSELRVGGRGIFLMRKLMDELVCTPHSGRRGNILRMVKHTR